MLALASLFTQVYHAVISIINVGREVNCSITVNGTQVEQRTGAGLTICAATR